MDSKRLTQEIKEQARSLGFDAIGVAPIEAVPGELLQIWLARQFHGEMSYMQRTAEKRADPTQVLPGVRSMISLSLNYLHSYQLPYGEPERGAISRYASGEDYHDVLTKRLEQLLARIKELSPQAEGKIYVDTGPVMDKHWAAHSGVGWLGKHTNVLSREAGSWFFLGEILLNLDLEYDVPGEDFCGSCTRCIDACPTDAITEPYVLDSRRCISYLTIELREDIPEEFRSSMDNLIFGCDICQDVCPWNDKVPQSSVEEFQPREGNRAPDLTELSRLSAEDFSQRYRKSPIKRAKWRGFMRNVAVAMGNSGNPEMIPDLEALQDSEDPMIRRHAEWALKKLEENRGQKTGR
jgi:epoxyqueuosine reductase